MNNVLGGTQRCCGVSGGESPVNDAGGGDQ